MSPWIFEVLFWSVFTFLNGLNFVINYLFHRKSSHFFPFILDLKRVGRLGITESLNLDIFRFVIEISLILLISRFIDLSPYAIPIAVFYLIVVLFNVYQYSIRHIYYAEPVFYNDLRLLKNGISIIWYESKGKVALGFFFALGLSFGFYYVLKWFLEVSVTSANDGISIVMTVLLSGVWVKSIMNQKGGYAQYPNDIYLRFHFSTVEIGINIRRSLEHFRLSKEQFGIKYKQAREKIALKPSGPLPNIFCLFIESYGSYYYEEPTIRASSLATFDQFQSRLNDLGFGVNSNFSTSTTFGGQSWLAYSSMFYGYRMSNNTLFENHLQDKAFRESNNLFRILQKMGYRNYNLNPITPIDGINVPYDEMREFYTIDRWILNKDIQYTGDEYGFGSCAPDQYSMNFMMDLINKEYQGPFTYFYLTKNSHSPFLVPSMVDDWRSLNKNADQAYINKGFLSYPTVEQYQEAIQYELDVIEDFITRHGKENDLFLLIGDHQPPILCDEKTHGLGTPIHVLSRQKAFVQDFDQYGFKENLSEIEQPIRHESIYSMFLEVFSRHYTQSKINIPAYEPHGLQLN